MREPYLGANRKPQRAPSPQRVPSARRAPSLQRVRSPRRVPMIIGVGLLLLLGVLGFSARRPHVSAHAPAGRPSLQVEPRANPDAGHRVLPPRPTSVRNG